VRQVIDKLMNRVREGLEEWHIFFELDKSAYIFLMEHGYDSRYGAREMERAIERYLVQPLSKALLERRFTAGAIIRIGFADDKIHMEDIGKTRGVDEV
jgi:ATP-dependent Clp protease ATP-binding subunit ClpA